MNYLRRTIWDIEVNSPNEFPKPEEAKHPISAITVYDSFTDHFFTLVLNPFSKKSKMQRTPNWDIYFLNNESDIYIKTIQLIQTLDPDTFEGFFSRTFDFPYIFNRFTKLDFNPSLLSPLGYVSNKNNQLQVSGRHVLDIVDADKKFKKRTSYSLKNIAEEEQLPIKKITPNFDIIHTAPEQLAEYNKTDVEVSVELDKKMQHIKRYVSRWQFSGLEDINKAMSNSIVVDTVMLREAKELGIVLPSKPEREEVQSTDDDNITGGLTVTPIIGIHDWVNDYDESRFYPNLAFLIRISPENISDNGTLVSANGTRFIDNPNTFLPRILLHFFRERDKVQTEKAKLNPDHPDYWKYHIEDENIKFLLNSVPGYFGQHKKGKSRLYDARILDSITTSGQYLILKSKEYIESKNEIIVYGDTDSLHHKTAAISFNEALDIGKKSVEELNSKYSLWAKEKFNVQDASSIRIVFEKIFRRIIYIPSDKGKPVKKRYAARLVWEKGKPTDQLFVRGFEIRRSDTAKISKTLQTDILKKILYVDNVNTIKKELIQYVQNIIKTYLEQPLSDIAIPYGFSKPLDQYGGINKNGGKIGIDAEVRGAKYSNTFFYTDFGENSKVKLLYLNRIEGTYVDKEGQTQQLPQTDVICFEDEAKLPKVEVNYEKMIDLTIRKKIERILGIVGISWREIEGNVSLFSFEEE